MALLLRAPSINPHATLITLFMNMIDDNLTREDQKEEINLRSKSSKRLAKYLTPKRPVKSVNGPFVINFAYARGHMFANKNQLDHMPLLAKATMKDEHTIVEKWPYGLKLEPGQKSGKEEFDLLMAGGPSGKELYLKWKRTQG